MFFQVASFIERQERLSEEIDKLARSLEETEERVRRSTIEGKVGAYVMCARQRAGQWCRRGCEWNRWVGWW